MAKSPMKKYAKAGKVKPVDIDMKGLEEMSRPRASLPKADLETKVLEGRNLAATRKREAEETAPKKQSFGSAFAAARKRGDKTFTWNGGSYGTKLKGEGDEPASRGMSDTKIRKFMGDNDRAADASTKAAVKPAETKPVARQESRVGLHNSKLGRAYLAERASHAESNQKLVDRYKKEGRPNLAKLVSYFSDAKYAKGGSVTRGDGIARKGHTKGKMV